MSIFTRKNRHVFRVSGPDAEKLLADVFTGQMPTNQSDAHWWALLSPQGKIQAEGLMGLHDHAYWLDVSSDIAEKFHKRMSMYKLRADAEIQNLGQTHLVGASETDPKSTCQIAHRDIRHPEMGFRIIAVANETIDWHQNARKYDESRVKLGIAELGQDFGSDNLFPHDIGMDLLNGIDFDKGCYVGQEVVSRMRHKAQVRRRPVIVSVAQGELGDDIMLGHKSVGKIGTPVHEIALGIVRLDRITERFGLTINDQPTNLSLPSWADYDFAPASESQ